MVYYIGSSAWQKQKNKKTLSVLQKGKKRPKSDAEREWEKERRERDGKKEVRNK